MQRRDQPDTTEKKIRLTMPLIKTVAAGVVVFLFILLNIFVLRNASDLVPSERTQQLLWFYSNPAFWPDWIAQALWMLAIGAVLVTILRIQFLQKWLESFFVTLVKKPFPFHIVFPTSLLDPTPLLEWIRKIANYPVERWIIKAAPLCFEKIKPIFHPRYFPLLALVATLLGTGHFVVARFVAIPAPILFLHSLIVFVLQLPLLLLGWFFVFPLYDLVQTGAVSWRLPGAVIIPFGLVMGGYLYGQRIKKFLLREDVRPLLMRYSIIVAVVYILFLSPLLERLSQIYQYVLYLPTHVLYSSVYALHSFLYTSEVSRQLLIFPILLLVMLVGFVFNPFRRLGRRINFSGTIAYSLLWTILFFCFFFVIVWKTVLQIGAILFAYYVAIRYFAMPTIQTMLTAKGKKIIYKLFVGFLVVFDIFIIAVDVYVIHQLHPKVFYSFFYVPFVDFVNTGQPSWNLLGPALVALAVFFIISFLIQTHYEQKSTASPHTSVQKMFLFGSLLVILLFLNVLCFVALCSAGTTIPWTDVRLWPWWAMILPVSLIIFSVSGLLLMRRTKSIALLFLCVIASPNVLQAAESQIVLLEPAKFVSAAAVRAAAQSDSVAGQGGFLANPTIVDCFAAMEYRYTGGRYEDEPIKFRLRSPLNIEPGKTYPLIVWFHGLGESGNDNTRQLAHLQLSMEFFAGPNQQDFFMLATQCPGDNNQWTRSLSTVGQGDAPMTIAAEIMEVLLREYPIDVNRISACGFSSGGTGTWEFGRKSPRRLAAFGSCSGNPVREAEPEEYLGTAIWAFVNTGDPGVPSDDAVVFVDEINARGGNAFLTLYDAGGHDSWTRAMREEKLIGWLILQSLAQPGPPQGVVCFPLTAMQQFTWFALPILIILTCTVLFFCGRREEVEV